MPDNNKLTGGKQRNKLMRLRAKRRVKMIRSEAGRSLKFTRTMYSLLQLFIFIILVLSIITLFVGDDEETAVFNIFQCVLAIITINVPAMLQNRLKWYIPSWLQMFAVLFIFAHFITGEIFRAYDLPYFDKVLHTLAGLASAALGFSMVNILNNNYDEHRRLSPFFVAMFSFCFALAVSYLWELFEYGMDTFTGSNMQRWKDGLPPEVQKGGNGSNMLGRGTGLNDTMIDMLVMAIGGFVVSLLGYIVLKYKSGKFSGLLVHKVRDYESFKQRAISEDNAEMLNILEEIYTDSSPGGGG